MKLLFIIIVAALATLPKSPQALAQVVGKYREVGNVSKINSGLHSRRFEVVYRDKSNGLNWGRALDGKYTNGCVDSTGKFEASKCTFEIINGFRQVVPKDSDAALACSAIGARLPTFQEYESLIKSFDYSVGGWFDPYLTTKGLSEMNAIFSDMNGKKPIFFWSSSLTEHGEDFAMTLYVFDNQAYRDGDTRHARNLVRCVSP